MTDSIATYSTARGYVQSAYLMMANQDRFQTPDDSSFVLAFHMLSGLATELYLKAFLLSVGVKEAELRGQRVRHNLQALYAMARDRGLAEIWIEALVNLLGEKHGSFEYRYVSRESSYDLVDLAHIFRSFSLLDARVDDAIGASASLGKKPGPGWSFPAELSKWRF